MRVFDIRAVFLFTVILLTSSFLYSQNFPRPVADYLERIYSIEEDMSIALAAKDEAIQQGLPINIFIPGEVMAEPAGIENGEVFYTVYTDLLDYKNHGYLAFYEEIEFNYDLDNAYLNMGNGNIINEDIFLSQFQTSGIVAQGGDGIILVPESSNDRVMSFDRMTGDLIDLDFIPADPANLSTPISARPDNSYEGPVYLSDQLDDVVQLYDENTGSYLGQFAPPGPGKNTAILDNIRGTAFRNDNNHLLVTVGSGSNSDAIAEFDVNGNYVGNFIANGAGGMDSPFDVMYYEFDGSYITNGITSDDILKFDANGNFMSIFNNTDVSFPEQMLEIPGGGLLVSDFTVDAVLEFDNNGTLVQTSTTPSLGGHRGIYTLGNGNYMITTGSGVHEIQSDGTFVRTVVSGVSGRFIHEYGSNACLAPPYVECPQDEFINLGGGECDYNYVYDLNAQDTCGGVFEPITDSTRYGIIQGFESGTALPVGTHVFEVIVYNADSSESVSCTWTITVQEYPNPINELVCNDNVQVSLNENCEVYVNADMILEGGPYQCYRNYTVEIATDENFQNIISESQSGEEGAYLNGSNVGENYYVRITDPSTGNSCWGEILVEDKLIPELSCNSLEIPCLSEVEPGTIYGQQDSVIPFPLPEGVAVTPSVGRGPFVASGFDPCGDVTLNYEDEITSLDCDSIYSSIIYRDWTVVDESGNSTNCQDTIYVVRPTLADVILPPNYDDFDEPALSCNGNWDEGCIPGLQNSGNDPFEGNQYPDPCETGLVNAQLCDNIYSSYDDQVIDACGDSYKIIRSYTFLDWCTGEMLMFNQLIKVVDDEAPEIICPDDRTISVSANPDNGCLATFDIPDIINNITDACSPNSVDYTVESSAGTIVEFPPSPSGLRIVGLPRGEHSLTYIASDGCGNTSSCVQILEVVDAVQPVAVCDQNTRVALGQDGEGRVHWQTIDDGSYDNCGISRIDLRRMDPASNGCETGADDDWKPYIDFCCEDLLVDSVIVLFRVTDSAGNQNTCMVQVRVEEKIIPIVQAPADLTVSCTYDFNVLDLDDPNDRTFGSIIDLTKGEQRDTTFIFDEAYAIECLGDTDYDGSEPTHTIVDGYLTDNCNIKEMQIFFDDGRDQCGRGFIIRAFRAEDFSGNSQFDFQRITFVDCSPFTEDDINWPRQYDGTPGNPILTCEDLANDSTSADPTPQGTGVPTFDNDDECATVAIRYEDEVFDVVQDACFKIFRHWEVLDWCSFDSDTTQPWTYTQVIKVKDIEAPILEGCDDITICDSTTANCLGRVEISQAVMDCTPDEFLKAKYIIEPFNDDNDPADDIVRDEEDGILVEDGEIELFEMLPFGTHRITWIVEDMCGQVGSCEYLITVEDCKIPTPYCLNGLATVVMPATGEIEICAEDLDAGSFDNCGTLHFSFTSDIADSCMIVSCDDIRSTNVIEVEVWVTDNNGNQDYCVTYIRVQDPNDVCPGGASITVSGETHTNDNRPVDEVEIKFQNPNAPTPLIRFTDQNGAYTAGLQMGNDYEVTAKRDTDPLNGVSTWDIALIQMHILGLESISDPYDLIAANVNDDEQISGSDIIELRKVILGKEPKFPNNESWRFVEASENLQTSVLPRNYPEQIELINLTSDQQGQDFIAVKIGDLDGSVNPLRAQQGAEVDTRSASLVFDVKRTELKDEGLTKLSFHANEFTDVIGFQFTLEYERENMQLQKVEAGEIELAESNYANFADLGKATFSWNNVQETSMSNGEELFSLIFSNKGSGTEMQSVSISSNVTPAEAYLSSRKVDVRLNIENTGKEFALYQNNPNPFSDHTVIGFDLPDNMEATINIYDQQGKKVMERTNRFNKGYNQIQVNRSTLSTSGLYYIELISGPFKASKKMLVIEE